MTTQAKRWPIAHLEHLPQPWDDTRHLLAAIGIAAGLWSRPDLADRLALPY